MTKASAGYFFGVHRFFPKWASLPGPAPSKVECDTTGSLPSQENDLAWLSLSTVAGKVADPREDLSCFAMLPLKPDQDDTSFTNRRWM